MSGRVRAGLVAVYVLFEFYSAPVAAQFAQLHFVTGIDEGAVCNDGSPGAYYLQRATAYPEGWVPDHLTPFSSHG